MRLTTPSIGHFSQNGKPRRGAVEDVVESAAGGTRPSRGLGRPVFRWLPKDTEAYRVIFGDLSIRDVPKDDVAAPVEK